MSDRKFLIAANWKMNPAPAGALEPDSPYRTHAAVDVVVFPSFLDLRACLNAKILAGPQCANPEAPGARTGDISIDMIKGMACRYVLCGHSERRKFHDETDADIAAQVVAALERGMHPVVCIGETEEERKAGKEKSVIKRQLKGLPLTSDITVAYEPVWAIGTGKTATPNDAQEMHAYIRSLLPEERRATTRILYGGSMKAENAEELLKQPDIDGGLIGGASLKPAEFGEIVKIAARLSA